MTKFTSEVVKSMLLSLDIHAHQEFTVVTKLHSHSAANLWSGHKAKSRSSWFGPTVSAVSIQQSNTIGKGKLSLRWCGVYFPKVTLLCFFIFRGKIFWNSQDSLRPVAHTNSETQFLSLVRRIQCCHLWTCVFTLMFYVLLSWASINKTLEAHLLQFEPF